MGPEVGSERPVAKIQCGRYVGNNPDLQGHTVLISLAPTGRSTQGIPRDQGWFVQDDDRLSAIGYGWWWFPKKDWEPT